MQDKCSHFRKYIGCYKECLSLDDETPAVAHQLLAITMSASDTCFTSVSSGSKTGPPTVPLFLVKPFSLLKHLWSICLRSCFYISVSSCYIWAYLGTVL